VAEEIERALHPLELVLKDRGLRPAGHGLRGPPESDSTAPGASGPGGGPALRGQLHGHHDTGLFLDHRKTRALVRQLSAGQRVLNLFCYTGSFSVYAAAGGARSVTSIDLSRTYLDWTQRNLALNNLGAIPHYVVQEDIYSGFPRPGMPSRTMT